MVENVLKQIQNYNKNFDGSKIEEAFKIVSDKCPNFEENIQFALKCLDIIFPLHPDEDTIISLILYKLFQGGLIQGKDIKVTFGEGVYKILKGVKSLEALNYSENDRSTQIEILRRMFLTMAKDIRVVLIELVCRLCKMQDLEDYVKDPEERRLFAKETLDLYIPIAARLGIYRLKSNLEDLSFRYTNYDDYQKISKELVSLKVDCQLSIKFVKNKLNKFLQKRGIKAQISGRIKTTYSIHRKITRKGLSGIDDLFDIYAMRIILSPKKDEEGNEVIDHLYSVLGMIHSEWKPLSKRFKDYLAVPKPNGYRSLHTVLLGLAPEGNSQPVEIQICDSDMFQSAEYGVASHWVYKDDSPDYSRSLKTQIDWIRGLEEIRNEFDLSLDKIKEVDIDIFKDRIFALTPRGEVKDLPRGAIPIDFAYSVHTDVGNRCVMAKVNGKVVPLDSELENGDVVEIVIKKDSAPKHQWLALVKTNYAKSRIKLWFSSFDRDNNVKEGRKLLNNQLIRIGKPTLDQKYSVLKNYCGNKFSYLQREGIVEEVGSGGKMANDVIRKVYPYEENLVQNVVDFDSLKKDPISEKVETKEIEDQVLVGGESGLPIKIAACCGPALRDNIVGYVTRGNSVTIHRMNCRMLKNLNRERLTYAGWKSGVSNDPKYIVGIKIVAMSRVGLVRDISAVILNVGINIITIALKQTEGRDEEHYILELSDLSQFDMIVDRIEKIKGVLNVSKLDDALLRSRSNNSEN